MRSGGPYAYSFSQDEKYLSFATTYDYYVLNGFSLEPEVSMTWIERSKPAFYLLANVSYTQMLPQSNVALFGRIGYGIANSEEIPIYAGGAVHVTDALKVGIFNAGVGTKVLISKSALVRLELNYKSQSWKSDYAYLGDTTISNIGLFTGLSFLF